MPCICVTIVCIILTVSSPSFLPVDPSTATADAVGYDYLVDDPSATAELPGKQCPIPSPRYCLYNLYFICCTRHFCFYVTFLFYCIACFYRPLIYLPLSYV